MNCRDVREADDSFPGDALPMETRREILRHLHACASCRAEIEARHRLRGALRTAFNRAPELQPTVEFVDRLSERLREAATRRDRVATAPRRWLALAACLMLAAALGSVAFVFRSTTSADALARDAIGDHWNCALKHRLVRTPVPLEEAAQRFDEAYRLLRSDPPDDFSTPDGPARVIDRHACAYGPRRFGHVVLQYRGRVVSLLVTANDGAAGGAESADVIPHVIGRPVDGLSVVSVNGSRHAIVLVSDLETDEMTQLSKIVSLPMVQRLGASGPDRGTPTAWFIAPVQQLAFASGDR